MVSQAFPYKLAQRLFFGIVLSFLLATVISEWSSRTIDQASLAIATNAGPSVRHLEAMRTELNSLPLLATVYVERAASGQAVSPDDLLSAEQRMERELTVYLTLPVFPGEAALWSQVKSRDAAIRQLVSQVQSQVESRRFEAAGATVSGELSRAVSDQVENLLGLIEFNASQSEALALRISTTRRRTQLLTLTLDALCAGLAVVAARMLGSASRRYSALIVEHDRLVEGRAAELEQFASRVAHDILSPLSPIAMALDLATQGLDESDPKRRWLRHAEAGLDRVQRLVVGLLAFARAGAQPEPGARASVGEVVRGVLDGLAAQASSARVELRCEVAEPCEAACPPALLGSVVTNLVQNAVKYMGDSPVRVVLVRAATLGDRVHVWVEDTGPGVPAAMRERIFEPHVRAAQKGEPGIGLGLATVKKIVHAYGGLVSAAARPGGGTSFFFDLPAATGVSEEAAADSMGQQPVAIGR